MQILLFELKYRFRRWDTYLYFLAFFVLSFYSVSSSDLFRFYGDAGGRIYANSAITIDNLMRAMSVWLIAISAALMSTAVIRDKETNTHAYYYALPITKAGYLLGRYFGTLAALLFIALAVMAGFLSGYLIPDHDPAVLQPFKASYFLVPFLQLIIWNVLVSSLIFFAMVNLTKHVMGGYMTAVIIVALNMLSLKFQNPDDMRLFVLSDPYGSNASYLSTIGRTLRERNTMTTPFSGWLMYNRFFWMGIGLALFVLAYIRFSFRTFVQEKQRKKKQEAVYNENGSSMAIVDVPKHFGFRFELRHMLRQAWIELGLNLRSVFFLVMISAATFVLCEAAFSMYTNDTLNVLSIKDGYFSLFPMIILVFLAGEAVNRERETGLANITDTMPIHNWVFTGSKLLSLIGVSFMMSTLLLLVMILSQWWHGFFVQPYDVYILESYLITFPYYALLAVLAFCIQVLVKNKFLGHTIMLLFFLLNIVATRIGIDHNMLFYASPPKPVSPITVYTYWGGYSMEYDDLIGYAPYAEGRFWLTLYWLLFAGILVIVVNALWKRGIGITAGERWQLMRSRWNRPAKWSFLLILVLFIGTGAFCFYNINILNDYYKGNSKVPLERAAAYERKYKRFEKMPLPWVTDIDVHTELYPSNRRADIGVTYTAVNQSGRPVDTLFFSLLPHLQLDTCTMAGYTITYAMNDPEQGFYVRVLDKPLLPGQQMKITFQTHVQFKGFRNQTLHDVARFSANFMELAKKDLPLLGYVKEMEAEGIDPRREMGLIPRERFPSLTDTAAHYTNMWSPVSDWVNMKVTIGTDGSHLAAVNEEMDLVKEWKEKGRNYFRFQTSSPVPFGLSLYSGKFTQLKETWQGRDSANHAQIIVYLSPLHLKQHPYNAPMLIKAVKEYLDAAERLHGKVSQKNLRYVESGNLMNASLVMDTTMLGWQIDYSVTYSYFSDPVGHHIAPAKVEGYPIFGLMENLYLWMLTCERKGSAALYGKRYNLKSTNESFLTYRGATERGELPVFMNDSRSMTYKTSIALEQVKVWIGDDAFRNMLLQYQVRFRGKKKPYPVSTELIPFIRGYVPDSLQERFDEYFYKRIVYENQVKKVTAKQLADKSYRLDVEVETHKGEDDGFGVVTPMKLDEWIEIGIYTAAQPESEDGIALADIVQPVKIKDGINRFTLFVKEKPRSVIIDPHYFRSNTLLMRYENLEKKKVKLP